MTIIEVSNSALDGKSLEKTVYFFLSSGRFKCHVVGVVMPIVLYIINQMSISPLRNSL